MHLNCALVGGDSTSRIKTRILVINSNVLYNNPVDWHYVDKLQSAITKSYFVAGLKSLAEAACEYPLPSIRYCTQF